MKIQKIMEESINFYHVEEADPLREDGGEMIDGTVDLHPMKEEALQPIVTTIIYKVISQNAQEISSTFFFDDRLLKKIRQKIEEKKMQEKLQ